MNLNRPLLVAGMLAGVFLGTVPGVPMNGSARAQAASAGPSAWPEPDAGKLPDNAYGELVRYGQALVAETYKHIGPEAADQSRRFAGNNLACQSCHLQAATWKFGLPLVGVYGDFPQYRPREGEVGTLEDRVNGCMERSMNGRKLPVESREMKAYLAYIKFISDGIPVGARTEGRGTPMTKVPNRAADPVRGATVYAESCVACHGEDGQGVRNGVPGDSLGYQFPPLWGLDSYNTGAGMHRVIVAYRFIRANMPLGASHENVGLSDDDAFDVAAFINSQPRPEKTGLEHDFPNRAEKPIDAPFPPWDDEFSAQQHKYGPFPPILAARQKRQAATR